jgi:hypothetical protein
MYSELAREAVSLILIGEIMMKYIALPAKK